MRKNLKSEILARFDQQRLVYSDLSSTVAQLLQTLLSDEGLVLHATNHRCKDRHSLEGKLGRPGKVYGSLEDITDIAGVRLTTYFADDVDKVAEVLRKELYIDESASIDKRISSDPDRFGYLSLHYVAQLSEDRVQLREYRRYRGLKFEIQIRSILQHAWAEIEHDLGYKSASGIPADARRRFARISSLLELADSEFCAIREQLSSYEKGLPEVIRRRPEIAVIDLPTLKIIFEKDPDVIRLDNVIAVEIGAVIERGDSSNLEDFIERLRFFGISTVDSLKGAINENFEAVKRFANYWVEGVLGEVNVGIGIFYLFYVLVWKRGDHNFAMSYLDRFHIEVSEYRESLAAEILAFKLDE